MWGHSERGMSIFIKRKKLTKVMETLNAKNCSGRNITVCVALWNDCIIVHFSNATSSSCLIVRVGYVNISLRFFRIKEGSSSHYVFVRNNCQNTFTV